MLAARTQDSTKEIQAIIEQLQSQSQSANSGVQETLAILAHNQQLSGEVQALLGGITEAVNQINGANAQVATAAEEQSCVTADINRNITNIHEIVNQNAYRHQPECRRQSRTVTARRAAAQAAGPVPAVTTPS